MGVSSNRKAVHCMLTILKRVKYKQHFTELGPVHKRDFCTEYLTAKMLPAPEKEKSVCCIRRLSAHQRRHDRCKHEFAASLELAS
mmetsp:Transcript_286/g.539  ORF Transcript_286/g.539 Transcript_286/m.539 type:complete len:85 (-) Transcript_286:2738-2992(-)